MDGKLEQDIRTALSDLERLVRVAGSNEIGDHLRRILESPNQIAALHRAFSKRLKRSKGSDTLSSEQHTFFTQFVSPDGGRLSDAQIHHLVSFTKFWELGEESVNDLKIRSLLWTARPELFWDGGTPDMNIIRRCYNDLERMTGVDPLKRKVLLVIFSQTVQEEQRRLREEQRRQRSRKRKIPGSDASDYGRDAILLTASLRTLSCRLWPDLKGDDEKKQRKSFSAYSLAGWKWQQLQYIEMILSLQHSPVKRFERHKWKLIEVQAINAFVKTLPQFRIREYLQEAWNSIVSYYRGEWRMNATEHDVDCSAPATTFSELTEPPLLLSRRRSTFEPNAGSLHRPADNCGAPLPRDDRGLVQDHNPTLHHEEQEAAQILPHIHNLAMDLTETAQIQYTEASHLDCSYTRPQVRLSKQNQAERIDGSESVPFQTIIPPGQQEQDPPMSSASQASDSTRNNIPQQAKRQRYNTHRSSSDVNSTLSYGVSNQQEATMPYSPSFIPPSLDTVRPSTSPQFMPPASIDTTIPSASPSFVPPSSINTMMPSANPQFVPPMSIDTATLSAYPQFFTEPMDIIMSSSYPQFVPQDPVS
ncbi:hypothetical protein KXX16_005939 [Aspergillus fumigatus]|nr:hypothetical protein KXX67_006709 [Aspergillus fumigatus]KAH1438612.1 hypothetical protein KXX68_006702 [Aspergillus fumigatus]KAH1527450.1 hypothetical protein KXX61_006046 [Aspergillus fumigatus]KAH1560374.1 hypothetical protein KXX28_006271 [Aspergillus fumigatus]KAH1634487.1 hypothetical protein KXX16_005939 [Aspergillus fumigatus]